MGKKTARVLWAYAAQNKDELDLAPGDAIEITVVCTVLCEYLRVY